MAESAFKARLAERGFMKSQAISLIKSIIKSGVLEGIFSY